MNKQKIIIYGRGEYFAKHKHQLPTDIEIVAYADSAEVCATSVTGELYQGLPILCPSEIEGADFDAVYICTDYTAGNRIFQTLIANNVPSDKIFFLNRLVALRGTWKYEPTEDKKGYISTIGRVSIKEQFLTDFDIVTEVYIKNTYHFEIPYSDYIVIDMGMNIGAASLHFAAKPEVSRVYGFEPFPDTYRQALENFERNPVDIRKKIVPFHMALLDKDEKIRVAVPAEQTGWRNIFARNEEKEQVEIICRTAGEAVTEILKENQGKHVVLKCDTEGSEFAIFNSLDAYSCFDGIDVVMMEIHGDESPVTEIIKKYEYTFFIQGISGGLQMLYAVK